MKMLEISKQEFYDLKVSFNWINQHHFATLEMLPKELANMWLDQKFSTPNLHNKGKIAEVIFYYGHWQTQSLLSLMPQQIDKIQLEDHYQRWQIKIAFSNFYHQGLLPSHINLDEIPLFQFQSPTNQELEDKWNYCSQLINDLSLQQALKKSTFNPPHIENTPKKAI
jgi:hypothetical protein